MGEHNSSWHTAHRRRRHGNSHTNPGGEQALANCNVNAGGKNCLCDMWMLELVHHRPFKARRPRVQQQWDSFIVQELGVTGQQLYKRHCGLLIPSYPLNQLGMVWVLISPVGWLGLGSHYLGYSSKEGKQKGMQSRLGSKHECNWAVR
jgi:hypothetical protein